MKAPLAAVFVAVCLLGGCSSKGFYDGVRNSREANATPAEKQRTDQSKSYEEYERERQRVLKTP